MKGILKGFYGVLKSADKYLSFILLTGVTKFSQVSIFSDLNQVTDISLDSRFATICGFTQEEVESYFSNEIDHFSQQKGITREEYIKKLKLWYNGYRFSELPNLVYNSFGLLNHFFTGKFEPYWFTTGTPTFLIKLIQEQNIDIINLEKLELTSGDFADYRRDVMTAIPVLYQSGYLTIVDYDENMNSYTLDYPNLEVRSAFADVLAKDIFDE